MKISIEELGYSIPKKIKVVIIIFSLLFCMLAFFIGNRKLKIESCFLSHEKIQLETKFSGEIYDLFFYKDIVFINMNNKYYDNGKWWFYCFDLININNTNFCNIISEGAFIKKKANSDTLYLTIDTIEHVFIIKK